jgi:hypothetical protein
LKKRKKNKQNKQTKANQTKQCKESPVFGLYVQRKAGHTALSVVCVCERRTIAPKSAREAQSNERREQARKREQERRKTKSV